MLSRRELMTVAGLAAVPAPALWAVPGAGPRSVRDPGFVYAVIYDDRFIESVRFGAQARQLGYRTSAISGDVTALWYHDLYHRWKKGSAAIAGMTTPDAALCLRLFGADAGLRCVFEAQHRIRNDQAVVEHRVRAPADWSSLANLADSEERWPDLMSRLIETCPVLRRGTSPPCCPGPRRRGRKITRGWSRGFSHRSREADVGENANGHGIAARIERPHVCDSPGGNGERNRRAMGVQQRRRSRDLPRPLFLAMGRR